MGKRGDTLCRPQKCISTCVSTFLSSVTSLGFVLNSGEYILAIQQSSWLPHFLLVSVDEQSHWSVPKMIFL